MRVKFMFADSKNDFEIGPEVNTNLLIQSATDVEYRIHLKIERTGYLDELMSRVEEMDRISNTLQYIEINGVRTFDHEKVNGFTVVSSINSVGGISAHVPETKRGMLEDTMYLVYDVYTSKIEKE